MKKIAIIILCISLIPALTSGKELAKVSSPDGRVRIEVSIQEFLPPFPEGQHLAYSILYRDKVIVSPSPVRLNLKGAQPIGANLEAIDVSEKRLDEKSELPYGKTRFLHNYVNEACLLLEETSEPRRRFELIARAYNDAACFRLRFPRQPGLKNMVVEAEKTYIRLEPGTAYALTLKNFQTSYENNYSILPLDQLDPETLVGLPLLVNISAGPWVAITEADLDDYPGMYVSLLKDTKNTLVSRLSPLPSEPSISARIETPHDLPWRVFMISDHPGSMIESDVVMNLSEPCKLENPGWIKPGKAAWPWWSGSAVIGRDFKGGMNTATMKYYIDFAHDGGFEYLLIDADWYGDYKSVKEDITKSIPEINLPEIISYGKVKGVDIILWLNWQCVRDQMGKAFPLYEKWGVKGVKVDYMNRDDQEMVNFYCRVVETAARYHLIVDFHGAYKPTGLRRAYPNLLTREGVLGLEHSKWSDKCSPDHEVIIPYTRMLAGPMDFTPGAFHVATKEAFKPDAVPPMAQGTRAHQLAMYVVYESPLQMVVDHPASLWGQKGYDFLKVVPTVWDETLFIGGVVGDYIVLARRKGEEWYLGGMTGWTKKSVNIPLSFLSPGKYMASLYSDAPGAETDPTQVEVKMQAVTRRDSLELHMAPGGGCAIRFVPTWD